MVEELSEMIIEEDPKTTEGSSNFKRDMSGMTGPNITEDDIMIM